MNTIEAINARHSVGNFKPDAVSRNVIENLLSAAVQAPNHHKIRPWRFFVIAGAARDRLGEAMAEGLRRRNPLIGEESLIRERAKPLRAPAIIAVAVDRPTEERIIEIENICAAAAACQNLLLAAGDMVYVPRSGFGDIKLFNDQIRPLLELVLWPARVIIDWKNAADITGVK